ncbi:hypothetical protein [Pedobacter sp. L105]|uniref:hypothetical protein n=1 Tax=Pedobacter sp. L105 TaxID=1641871 RepID=UPI00131E6DE9|nr:hypothetical protein [Pedobacter sp. L105]
MEKPIFIINKKVVHGQGKSAIHLYLSAKVPEVWDGERLTHYATSLFFNGSHQQIKKKLIEHDYDVDTVCKYFIKDFYELLIPHINIMKHIGAEKQSKDMCKEIEDFIRLIVYSIAVKAITISNDITKK